VTGRARPLLGAAGVLLLGLFGCRTSERFVSIGVVDAARPAAGVHRLEVRDPSGSIRVEPGGDDEVSVTAEVRVHESLRQEFPAADAARDLKIEVDGDVLRIGDAHEHDHRNDFSFDLTIHAPTRLAWRLELGAGEIRATGGGNAIEAESGAGEVRIEGAVATLRATSGAGEVIADLESIAGGLLHSGAGSVRLTVAGGTLKEKLTCTSGAGKVAIELPAGFSADAALKSGAGRVVVEGAAFAATSHVAGGSASGRLGAGGPPLVAETGAGEVILRVRS
jgi:hypothetical protein